MVSRPPSTDTGGDAVDSVGRYRSTPAAPAPELFSGATLDTYVDAVNEAVALLVAQVRDVDRPRREHRRQAAATVADLERAVGAVDLDRPLAGTSAALREVEGLYLDHAVWFHEPTSMAHLNCPVAIPALAAEVLVSGVNTSMDTWDQSTSATFMERRLIDWTAGRIGFGAAADGVFTSGGTQSNLQALLLAREQATDRGVALDRMRVLATDQSHFSVTTSARLLGFPAHAVLRVPTDAHRRMDSAALDAACRAVAAAGDVPVAVIATAGATDLGVIDPLPAIARVAQQRGLWLHVDAAYGCGLLLSRRRRHLLAGIERADSVTIDAHKSFFQPLSCSSLLVRDGATLRHVTHYADYLNPHGGGLPNQVDKSLQTTRRFDALKLWLTLRAVGADRLGDMFDTVCDLAETAHAWMTAQEDLEVAAAPTLSTLLFRYRPAGCGADEAGDLAPLIRRALFDQGAALVGGTRLDGEPWLKLTLLNPATTLAHVQQVVDAVRLAGAGLRAEALVAP